MYSTQSTVIKFRYERERDVSMAVTRVISFSFLISNLGRRIAVGGLRGDLGIIIHLVIYQSLRMQTYLTGLMLQVRL